MWWSQSYTEMSYASCVVQHRLHRSFQVEESSGYDIISKTFTEHEKCGLKQIQAFKMPMVAIPLQKLSGYRELFATRSAHNSGSEPLL